MANVKGTKKVTQSLVVVPETTVDVINYTAEDEVLLKQCKATIEVCLNARDSVASKLSQMLYIASERKLYELEGYHGIGAWAEELYGLKKASVSEAIKVYSRFGTQRGIVDKYAKYAYSTLVKLAPFTDEEISYMCITPEMSRREALDRIHDYNALCATIESADDDEKKRLESATTLDGALDELTEIRKEHREESSTDELEQTAETSSTDELETSSADEPEQTAETSSTDEQENDKVHMGTVEVSTDATNREEIFLAYCRKFFREMGGRAIRFNLTAIDGE